MACHFSKTRVVLALTFNTIRHTRWSIVMIPRSQIMVMCTTQIFSSASCVQQMEILSNDVSHKQICHLYQILNGCATIVA